ncbi:MAG: acyltransferase, partial [Muribaculaceae bacterium]|nr:acyltransferase [Muribaculaceae bacterium]
MSKILRTGIIQQANCADAATNRRRIAEAARELAASGARLIVNRELHDSLYFCQTENVDTCDLAVDLSAGSDAIEFYSQLARECGAVLVTSLFERRAAGMYHN